MKLKVLIVLVITVFACNSASSKKQTVELSCGQCQFGLTSQEGCDLAVRIDDKAYFVDGADIDDFGDAHDKDSGFCEVIRTAEVSGDIIDDRFKVNTIALKD
ncbi:hypothetical protein ES692_03810 [Psychroserpens burtonensis]|uniref:Uncharacterized protein n=1 Tax=Psychroserpens burtonensis TaxID=49278 RepID=A0A5C7BAE0_9FLAO|nr:DUF6370 family protein [Psychroserpens burtonensis]TXE19416.1 hypothetical protein ES692_03810 [Psychroserpens burtonensis]